MPHYVEYEVAANAVRKGDVISENNTHDHYWGATIDLVKHGIKYTEAFGPQLADDTTGGVKYTDGTRRQRLFRLPQQTLLKVKRIEPTPEELAERRARYLAERADDLLADLTEAYPKAKKKIEEALSGDANVSDSDVHRLLAATVQRRIAARLRAGIEHHAEQNTGKTLVDLFRYLHEELVERAIERTTAPARMSGGFTITNAREQIEFETNQELLRELRRTFGFGTAVDLDD